MINKIIKNICKKRLKKIDDFHLIVSIANKKNIISTHSANIITGALQTANLKARDVMVPKSRMVTIKHNSTLSEFLEIVKQSSHSRFPIIDDKDNVKGILLAKDLLNFMASSEENFDYLDYLRRVIIIPENKSLESLLKFFQLKKSHLMIVVDEYSEIVGLITLEDVLEQIVGEIEDEHDLEEDDIVDYGNNRFLVNSSVNLDEFNKYFNSSLESKAVDTISGFLSQQFGYLPKQLEKLIINNLEFKILKANSRKIQLIEVLKIAKKS